MTATRRCGRRPAKRATHVLPLPPALLDSSEGCIWIAAASAALHDASPLPGAVNVSLCIGLVDDRRDSHGIAQAIVALLIKRGILTDQASLTDWFFRWDRAVPSGQVKLEARQARPPSERIGAATRARISKACRARGEARA
jgi:hypothetical protein